MNGLNRYNPKYNVGLTKKQVKLRISEGLVHKGDTVKTKTIKEIINTNLYTLFNFINLILAVLIVSVGRYENLLFLGAVIANFFIALFQELKAKEIIDNLSLLNEEKINVIRNSLLRKIKKEKIVLDDVIKLDIGNQVVVDSIVIKGECLVNEAFISGEETPKRKSVGDMLLSGSFITSGSIYARVEHINEDNHISKISKEAKYIKKQSGLIINSLNKIIKYISYALLPIGIIMFIKQYNLSNDISDAIVSTAGALIGMIPEGLVLLTSTILAVSVIRLGKYSVLVQDLYSIESLARVDTLCLDKTGTLTAGKMKIIDEIVINQNKDYIKILKEIANAQEDNTPTMNSVRNKYKTSSEWTLIEKETFSSDTKCSKTSFKEGVFIFGSPEFILKNNKADEILENNNEARVLLLAEEIDGVVFEILYLVIQDEIRRSAKETISYLNEQGVNLKIISGDNPKTVSTIAKRVGIIEYDKYVDLSEVGDEDINNIASKYTIFGRVKPHQKKLIIKSLKNDGSKVAMIGDGVNDVLALKESDCSIAISDGSAASRNVSQLVLLNSDFKAIPHIIYEGRRVVNNLERSSTLFFMKTIYTIFLVAIFLLVDSPYPFDPIHLSVNNLVTIGIPSIILALEKNNNRISGDFFDKVIKKAFPFSLTIVLGIVGLLIIKPIFNITDNQVSIISMLIGTVVGFGLLFKISVPFNLVRRLLFYSMFIIYFIQLYLFKDLIKLERLDSYFSTFLFLFLFSTVIVMFTLQLIFDFIKINKTFKTQ